MSSPYSVVLVARSLVPVHQAPDNSRVATQGGTLKNALDYDICRVILRLAGKSALSINIAITSSKGKTVAGGRSPKDS